MYKFGGPLVASWLGVGGWVFWDGWGYTALREGREGRERCVWGGACAQAAAGAGVGLVQEAGEWLKRRNKAKKSPVEREGEGGVCLWELWERGRTGNWCVCGRVGGCFKGRGGCNKDRREAA